MRSRRGITVASLALISALLLTACSPVSTAKEIGKGIGGAVAAGEAVDAIISSLTAIHGVTAVNVRVTSTLRSIPTVIVHVDALHSSPEILAAISKATGAGLASRIFNGMTHELRVDAGASGAFDQYSFPIDATALTDELRHLALLSKVIRSPLMLTLRTSTDGAAYDRTFSVVPGRGLTAKGVIDHYVAFRQVADTSTMPTAWQVPGFSVSGAMPPSSLVAIFASMARKAPLLGALPKNLSAGLQLNWIDQPGAPASATIQYAPVHDQMVVVDKGSDWPTVVSLLRLLLASPVQDITFGYSPSVGNGQLCRSSIPDPSSSPGSAQDTQFLAAVTRARLKVPQNTYAGHCLLASNFQ